MSSDYSCLVIGLKSSAYPTPFSMMFCPGGPTTIPLLLASLSKLPSARWWSPIQRMKHQWRYFSLGECSSEAMCTPKGDSFICIRERCGVFASRVTPVFLVQSWTPKKPVGVVDGFACSKHTPGDCLLGFSQLNPVEKLEIWLFHPSLSKRRNTLQFPVGNDCSELKYHHTTAKERASWWWQYVGYSSFTSDKVFNSEAPLQLIYLRHKDGQSPST